MEILHKDESMLSEVEEILYEERKGGALHMGVRLRGAG